MQQITAPLADLPEDPVSAAADPDFPVVLRGYDRVSVDAYVTRITQLVAELYATRSPEGAVRRALERVGGEVSAILQRAHETAEQITSQSRAEAEDRVTRAREEADTLERSSRQRAREVEQEAQRRVQELDADVDRIWAERDRIVSDLRRLAEELGTLAGAAATRFPAEPPAEEEATGDEGAAQPAEQPVGYEGAPEELVAEDELKPVGGEKPQLDEAPAERFAPAEAGGEDEPFAAGERFDERSVSEPFDEPSVGERFDEPSASERFGEPPAGERFVEPPVGAEPFAVEEYVGKAQPIRREPAAPEPGKDDEEAPAEVAAGAQAEVAAEPGEPGGLEQPLGEEEVEKLAAAETAQLPVEAAADAPVEGEHVLAEQPTEVHEPLTARSLGAEPRLIDLMHLGRERVIGCWQLGDVLIDPGPSSCLEVLLEALGGQRPRALLLTHIHLDHAGASGSLVEQWPDLEVYVHERGAPHLMEPSRLLESARRLYGDDMDRLWGEVRPVPVKNVRLLRGGERLFGSAFEVVYTPGHASHHVSFLRSGTAFVGDTGGVRITPETLTIPPTPPPDVDIEAWHQSIHRILAWKPTRLAMTHFGSSDDVAAQLNEVAERLDNYAALARTEDQETFITTVREEVERSAGAELLPTYSQAAPPEQLYAGLRRYWEKREGAQTSARSAPAEASTHAGRFPRWGGG